MLISFTYHLYRVIWHVKGVLLLLVALVMAGAGVVTLFTKPLTH